MTAGCGVFPGHYPNGLQLLADLGTGLKDQRPKG